MELGEDGFSKKRVGKDEPGIGVSSRFWGKGCNSETREHWFCAETDAQTGDQNSTRCKNLP